MQEIAQIDQALTVQLEKLKAITNSIEPIEIVRFTLEEAAEKIPWQEIVYPGIYLLEIKNQGKHNTFEEWVADFKAEWENEKYKRKFTPNLKKVRIRAHSELGQWIPLYIGKSKNIGSRIHGHIYKELHKTTFALKLMARDNLKNEIFRLKAYRVGVDNYDTIVPKIEWQLRNRINPLIGKQ
jgi:hypothetical protein